MTKEIDVIEIRWTGPHSINEVISQFHGGHDYGIYQLYGTHNVLGSDTLLYIGKAQARPFGVRINEHCDNWIEWEPSEVSVYLGRIGGTKKMTEAHWPEWEDQISRAESLMVFFCAPPYNSHGLQNLPGIKPTLVLNFKRKHKLPIELSTFLWTSQAGSPSWVEYGRE